MERDSVILWHKICHTGLKSRQNQSVIQSLRKIYFDELKPFDNCRKSQKPTSVVRIWALLRKCSCLHNQPYERPCQLQFTYCNKQGRKNTRL